MTDARLVLETSGRNGSVAVARGGAVARVAALDAARRHARDLASVIDTLLKAEGLRPADLAGVMASVGPGGYTGLRVGLMSAKALAYATGCELVAVDTFAAVAEQAPAGATVIDVIGDALQGTLYVRRYEREAGATWRAAGPVRIEAASEWVCTLAAGGWVSGPGVPLVEAALPAGVEVVPAADRDPRPESVFRVGLRTPPATRAELFALEPLYLRGSSAEEKARRE